MNVTPISMSRRDDHYIVNLIASLDAVAPNTILNIHDGACSDQTNVLDIWVEDDLVVDSGVVGAGGLDTGVLIADATYYVLVLGDSSGYNIPAGMITLDPLVPIMPQGYDCWRVVDVKFTDAAVHFIASTTTGTQSIRRFTYDAPIAVLTATGAAAFTTVLLTDIVAPIGSPIVEFIATIVPIAAADTLILRPTSATGNYATMSGSVIAVPKTTDLTCPADSSTGYATVDYVTNGAGTAIASLSVKSFTFNL